MNWSDFFHMGGYALYVWGSYAAAAVVLTINVILPIVGKKRVLQRLRELAKLKLEQMQ
jgi:heme exporter protein D